MEGPHVCTRPIPVLSGLLCVVIVEHLFVFAASKGPRCILCNKTLGKGDEVRLSYQKHLGNSVSKMGCLLDVPSYKPFYYIDECFIGI